MTTTEDDGTATEDDGTAQPSRSASPVSVGEAADVALFSSTLSDLNEIAERQMIGFLEIAIAAAQTVSSLPLAKSDGAELSRLTEQLKATAAELSLRADTPVSEQAQPVAGTETATGLFREEVEANVNLAMRNAVANQQELNQLGIAILAQAVQLIFSASGQTSSD